MQRIAFIPASVFSALKPTKLAGLPPQAQSPEHIAHGAKSRRAGRLNGAVDGLHKCFALVVAHVMEIITVRHIESEVVIGAGAGAIESADGSDGKIR